MSHFMKVTIIKALPVDPGGETTADSFSEDDPHLGVFVPRGSLDAATGN